jgi:hypothetical protein
VHQSITFQTGVIQFRFQKLVRTQVLTAFANYFLCRFFAVFGLTIELDGFVFSGKFRIQREYFVFCQTFVEQGKQIEYAGFFVDIELNQLEQQKMILEFFRV